MASTIVTKNSSTASAVPVTGDLTQGELAVNVTDKKLYTKDSGGTVVKLVGGLGNQEANAVAITGGSINGTTVGATTASTGAFTTLSASSTVSGTGFSTYLASPPAIGGTAAAAGSFTTLSASSTTTLSGGTANGVAYLNGSKVVTTGSALTFDGTNFGLGVASPANYTNYRNLALSGTTGANIDLLSGATKVGNIFNDGTNFYLYNVTAGSVVFGQNNTEAMRLTSTGLGIGTSSPLEKLQVNGAILTTGSLSAVRTSAASLDFLSGNTRFISMGADASTKAGFIWYNSTNAAVTEAMRLDSSGNLGLGGTSSSSGITIAKQYGGVNITGGGGTYAQWGGGYGMFPLAGVGLGIASQAAMTFLVNNTSTQAMTLTAAGRLGLGLTSPSTLFEAYGGAAGTSSELTVGNASTAARFGVDTSNEVTVATGQAVPIKFLTSNTERARITSGGTFLVGTTNTAQGAGNGNKLDPAGAVWVVNAATNDGFSYYNSSAAAYRFYVSTGGTISATNTTISAISDQRFKENIQDLDVGLDAVMALKPRKFDWKSGKGKDIKGDRGFIAQEFEQVFPDLIDEWKDPAPEGEEPYKSVRQDLIPVLVKAIQELNAKVQTLEAQLNKGA